MVTLRNAGTIPGMGVTRMSLRVSEMAVATELAHGPWRALAALLAWHPHWEIDHASARRLKSGPIRGFTSLPMTASPQPVTSMRHIIGPNSLAQRSERGLKCALRVVR